MLNPKQYLKTGTRILVCLLGLSLSHPLLAAPGVLADSPLFTSTFAQPNVFFLVDSSGSMSYIEPSSPFDSSVTYYTCPSAMQIPAGSLIDLTVDPSGQTKGYPFFTVNKGTSYDWGNSQPNTKGNTKKDTRCFNNTAIYNANLYNSASKIQAQVTYVSDEAGRSYSGNYLNWYFGSSPTYWGDVTQKAGQATRLDLARSAVTAWINSLPNGRVGLGKFDGELGTNILVGMDYVRNNKNDLITALNGIKTVGGSPIAEAMRDVGRYFVENNNNTLTLHPGQIDEDQKPAFNIFNNQPNYNSGITKVSPIQYYCQGNFLLLLTDGRSSGDTGIDSSTGLQDYDRDCQNRTPACLTFDRKPELSYDAGGGSDYANDVAKALFEINLRPDLGSKGSTMMTYVLGFTSSDSVDIPIMKSIAANGGGLYGQANTAQELLNALTGVTVSILSSVSISAPVTFDGVTLTSNSHIFWVQYSTLGMTGDLIKASLSTVGAIGSASWHFAEILDKTIPANRFMFTYNPDTLAAVPFQTLSSLSTAQKADLNMGPSAIDSLGQARIDYLRGDRSRELQDFRVRTLLLGDIVNSGPVYVGVPSNAWPDSTPFPSSSSTLYSKFVRDNVNRQGVVYFGANDGMLHAVNADTGAEMFAYLPNSLFSNAAQRGYHYLTDPAYQHRFYVDLTPTVADVYTATANSSLGWRSVLVGGERNGGRGYFALDISNPGNFSSGNEKKLFLWEFSSQNDANLGYTHAKPKIALMNNGRWAAIFGNGYNNTGLGKASLFIVYLDGGLTGTWTQGADYLRFDTSSGTLANPDGLGEVAAVDLDGNGTVDRIYAGSVLTGQLWAFDVSSTSSSQWKIAYNGNPLFNTPGTIAQPMPITSAPVVVKHPSITTTTQNYPNVMVYFGTGQYLTSADPTNTSAQRLFGVWDRGDSNLDSSKLVQQTMTSANNIRTVSTNPVVYTDVATSVHGWYIALTGGERDVVAPKLGNNVVIFTTIIPNTSSSCSYGGSGWVIAVSQDKGGAPSSPFIDINGDNIVDSGDNVSGVAASGVYFSGGFPAQPSFLADYMYVPVGNDTISKFKVAVPKGSGGRLSWQELTGK